MSFPYPLSDAGWELPTSTHTTAVLDEVDLRHYGLLDVPLTDAAEFEDLYDSIVSSQDNAAAWDVGTPGSNEVAFSDHLAGSELTAASTPTHMDESDIEDSVYVSDFATSATSNLPAHNDAAAALAAKAPGTPATCADPFDATTTTLIEPHEGQEEDNEDPSTTQPVTVRGCKRGRSSDDDSDAVEQGSKRMRAGDVFVDDTRQFDVHENTQCANAVSTAEQPSEPAQLGQHDATLSRAGSADGDAQERLQLQPAATEPDAEGQPSVNADMSIAGPSGGANAAATGATVGPQAQSNNNQRCRPAKAIEAYANDVGRRKDALRVALRLLEQSREVTTPPALPPALPATPSQATENALQAIIDGLPAGAQSGAGTWVECSACLDDYGIHERLQDMRLKQHVADCHELGACVLCGCVVLRGDNWQYRKHRKSSCPLWRVLVHLGRHVEWLDVNGLVGTENRHGQFFDKTARDEAAAKPKPEDRRKVLLDALQQKEVEKLPAVVWTTQPLKKMIAAKDLKALSEEVLEELSWE